MAGVIAQQRAGDTTINAVLIGQNLAFANAPAAGKHGRLGGRRRLRLPTTTRETSRCSARVRGA